MRSETELTVGNFRFKVFPDEPLNVHIDHARLKTIGSIGVYEIRDLKYGLAWLEMRTGFKIEPKLEVRDGGPL